MFAFRHVLRIFEICVSLSTPHFVNRFAADVLTDTTKLWGDDGPTGACHPPACIFLRKPLHFILCYFLTNKLNAVARFVAVAEEAQKCPTFAHPIFQSAEFAGMKAKMVVLREASLIFCN